MAPHSECSMEPKLVAVMSLAMLTTNVTLIWPWIFSVSRKQKLVKNLTTGRSLYVQFSLDLTNFSAFILDVTVKHGTLELDDISETVLVPLHEKQLTKAQEVLWLSWGDPAGLWKLVTYLFNRLDSGIQDEVVSGRTESTDFLRPF